MGKQAKIKAQKRRERKLNSAKKEVSVVKETIYDEEKIIQDEPSTNIANGHQQENCGDTFSKREIEEDSKIPQTDGDNNSEISKEKIHEEVAIISDSEESNASREEIEEKIKISEEELRKLDYAEITFRKGIENIRPNHPNQAALSHNLSQILEKKGLYLQALEYSNKAVELAPDRTDYKEFNNRIKNIASQQQSAIDPIVEAERIRAAEKYYEEKQKEEAEKREKVNEDLECESKKNVINENIIPLSKYTSNVLQKRNPYIESKLIYSSMENITKSIFNSKIEKSVYMILIEQFPNYLVYPNMALQNIFDFDKTKEILDSSDFEYFLKAHVDFCIIKTSNYSPLVTLELDSHYHDDEEVKKKDEIKNQLFHQGGLSLLRIRPFEQPSEETIRAGIIESLEAWRQKSLESTSTNGPSAREQ
jgi:hypothetical protein